MEPLETGALPAGALVLVDSAPIIYVLEAHPRLAQRFRPFFDRQEAGEIRFAISTVAMAEVLTGPVSAGNETLAKRYRALMESWQVVSLTPDIAESAARFRARFKLRLADAVQLASAAAVNADALLTHDADFSKVKALRILS